jgi:hypothetical protein
MLVIRAHKIAVIIAFLLLSAWLIFSSWKSPQTIQTVIQYSGTTAEHRSASDQAAQEKEKTDEALARYTWWLTFFTGILAFATIGLGISTLGLYLAGERQLKLARNEFVSTHRPKLIIRQLQLDKLLPDQIVKVQLSIINIGETEATLRFIAAEIALWNRRYWEAPGIDPIAKPFGPKVIRNGQRISAVIVSRFKITAEQIKAAQQGNLIICAVGEFTYIDAIGTERRTGFRRNYDFSTDMFIASENIDQEYQD